MAYSFTTLPAYTVRPGTMIMKDGVIFSSVFRDCRQCGLILYHLPDLEKVVIPFTDDYRYGSLYSVEIVGLNPHEWAYRYYRDDYTFDDPYARELITVKTDGQPTSLAKLFPHPEDNLPAYGRIKHRDWSKRILYCLHVKGFTASKTSRSAARGTFKGLTDKIPYLKKLGINGVEIMPMYELRPEALGMIIGEPAGATEESRERTRQVTERLTPSAASVMNSRKKKDNYWNFGEGCYFAPKRSYSFSDEPQDEFADMVKALHKNDVEVFLQLYFPDNVSIQTQLETARFYVTHYQIDGFHLKGNSAALQTIATDPMLSDTALFYYDFPYGDLQKEDQENPTVGKPSVRHLCEYNDNFEVQVRRFVKSDNDILREFVKQFISVPSGHGCVHYVTNYEGFTLNDLVSYNWKHNYENGESNHDGTDSNWSWNCGAEGPSHKKDIRQLRNRQMRNFMALNLLAQGTPLILAGDERCNSQGGNNNPYCQDNETGWMNWKDTVDGKKLLSFTQQLTAFRAAHGVFSRSTPFKFNDYKVVGYPDVSLHGKEAWKPDVSGYSHTIGILFPEQYDEDAPKESLLYLAINMHWHNQQLALPKPPDGWTWQIIMDTYLDEPFCKEPLQIEDQRHINVRGRSIQILQAVPQQKEVAGKASPDIETAENNGAQKKEDIVIENHVAQQRENLAAENNDAQKKENLAAENNVAQQEENIVIENNDVRQEERGVTGTREDDDTTKHDASEDNLA